MTEVSLEGERYTGVFNGTKQEVNRIDFHYECYEGAGLIYYKLGNKKYFFRFLIPQKFSKSSLKESLESICTSSGGFDSLCQSVIFRMKDSKEEIPGIGLP